MKLSFRIALLISAFSLPIGLAVALTPPLTHNAFALVEGAITGTLTDNQGLPVGGAAVELDRQDGSVLKRLETSATGTYEIFPVNFGDYVLKINVSGFAPYAASIHVASGSTTSADIQLSLPVAGAPKEMILNVEAKRHLVQTSQATSRKEITSQQIAALPQGENISLPHLLSSTTPGVVQGTFGQTFIRGNHANIQYQIDGVQLPDSQTNTFGDAFTPRNIDHMEVITGGIPAEYGYHLAAVVNIITKTGPETPGGQAELNYGSYDTFEPWATYGGSNANGDLHYFFSAQYTTTSRGLDTPQPQNNGGSVGFSAPGANQSSGGTDAIHDYSNSNNQFFKIDWLPDNDDKWTFIGFNNYANYNLPNYPSNFLPTDAMYQTGFVDTIGNTNNVGSTLGASPYIWTPYYTNDVQTQNDAYAEAVWKHSFTDHSFYQQAAYYKYSNIHVNNDPTNDLLAATYISGADPASLSESRHVNNVGLKGDFTDRINDKNLFKSGYQLQDSRASGSLFVTEATNSGGTGTPGGTIPGYSGTFNTFTPSNTASIDNSVATGYTESVYAQNDFTITPKLILNTGLRFDAIQYYFTHTSQGDTNDLEDQLEPRVGLNYFVGQNTKLHAFYGRLFQPAPLEDLRDSFVGLGGTVGNSLSYYDIKAETDNYYEVGVAQQVGNQVVTLNTYYKSATNMLDDSGLLNTSLVAAYNYATGYAYGVELSVQGQINNDWSDYANYSYEIAKGEGASGGLFALPAGTTVPSGYQYLDHVQVSTANVGATYSHNYWNWTTQGLFGSGLRTGPNNSLSLPVHFTMDTSLGYDFHGKTWLSKFKLSGDMLNIFNYAYPVTLANGYNGARYAPGREYFVHLTKEL